MNRYSSQLSIWSPTNILQIKNNLPSCVFFGFNLRSRIVVPKSSYVRGRAFLILRKKIWTIYKFYGKVSNLPTRPPDNFFFFLRQPIRLKSLEVGNLCSFFGIRLRIIQYFDVLSISLFLHFQDRIASSSLSTSLARLDLTHFTLLSDDKIFLSYFQLYFLHLIQLPLRVKSTFC